MTKWGRMAATHVPDTVGSSDYEIEDEYATCPDCGKLVKVTRGKRLSSHYMPNSVFRCDGSNYPVKEIGTNG